MKIVRDFTSGPLLKQLIFFAFPFMASNALQVLYSIVDMAVVGHYLGKGGLAAVSISSQTFIFLTMLCTGLSQGGQVYLSQLLGSGQRQRIQATIGTLFTTLLGFGALISILGMCFARPIMKLLNTPADVLDDAVSYTFVCSAGLIFSYGYNVASAVLRGLGDSRHPFIFILIASVINVILDLLFVAVFHWGVFGAGLATILGQSASFLFAIFFINSHRDEVDFALTPKSMRLDRHCLKGLLSLGLPLACRFSIINISMLYVMAMVAGYGSTALSTFGAGLKLDDLGNKMSLGIMAALTGIVGQNYGARHFFRIRKAVYYTWFLSVIFYASIASALLFIPETLFSIFTRDSEVLSLSHTFGRAIFWTFPGLLIIKGTNGFINGIGNTWLALALGIIDGCILRIGLSWFLGSYCGMGFYGYVMGYGFAPWGSAIPGLLYFFFVPWEKRKLATEHA